MLSDLIPALACPRTGAPFDLDVVREADGEIVEAFLVSRDGRAVWPVVAGVAVLPLDLRAHLKACGSVYRRTPINDPRLARFLLSHAGAGYDVVPFDEVVGHYRDLAAAPPPGYATDPHPEDVALGDLLAAILPPGARAGRGVDVGSGVGRGTFLLRAHLQTALGLDRSIACVRRARNIAVTTEHFFLPAPKGSGLREIPLDLSRLARDGADFLVFDGAHVPLGDRAFDLLLLRPGDSQGAWPDAARLVRRAVRALRPGGWLLWHAALAPHVAHEPQADCPPFLARRVDA